MTEDKFLEIVYEHKDQIYRHAFYLLKNREDAEDITQETFIKAWEHRATLRAKTVRPWLLKCAQNLCFNLLRHRKFQQNLTEGSESELETLFHTHVEPSDPSPDEAVLQQELKEIVQQAIDKLPAEMRSVIVMRELDGMGFKQIAEVLEQPEGTVKSTVFRARKKLRETLQHYWREKS